MNKKIPLKLIIDSLSNEKGISKEIIFNAIEEAILLATTKKYKMLNVITSIDKDTGIYKTYALYNITEETKNLNPFKEISINQAQKYNQKYIVGDILKKEIESVTFGRIDAQIAKQIITKRVKNAEKEITINEFNKNRSKLISGIVKKITEKEIIITIDDITEGFIKNNDLIITDHFFIGNKIKGCFINAYNYGKEIKLSRTSDDMLAELLKLEIPEIKSNILEIKDIARQPGIRSKVSIKKNSKNIDVIGACIGLNGTRIKNISKELCGEKIEIINWDSNLFKYIINICAPIEIKEIEIDEKSNIINIFVEKKNLSKIIGKNGINIRLITKLIKWNLNINEYIIKK